MKIFFKKVLAYDRSYAGGDGFSSARDILLQHIDPPTLHPGGLVANTKFLSVSPLARAVHCVRYDETATTRVVSEKLREIPFDIARFINRNLWEQSGSVAVRNAFLEAFISDALAVSRAALIEEVEEFIAHAARLAGDTTAVSHSFRMKLAEAFLGTAGKIRLQPELIRRYLSPDKRTYEFGAGFVAKI